ncbi:MAG: tRNA 4-thiouridine(8) synthase ThiI [Chloroflexi bacterium]|nr:tRNA 4-thiouridine(8) synthase ThiI [Chloroflexota bacterium]
MTSDRCVLIHYHEIALKGRNRGVFIDRLIANLRRAVRPLGVYALRETQGGVLVDLPETADWNAVRAAVETTCGVVNFALVSRCAADYAAVETLTGRLLDGRSFDSFRIDAHRSDKQFPMTSEEINRALGTYVVERTGARVDLKHAEQTIYVKIARHEAFVYFEKLAGPGGLPVGVSGHVLCLISGGIDSPVAAARLMRRGCSVEFVHFHAYPFLNAASIEKARELVQLLTRYQGTSRLHLVPFGEVQRQVVLSAPEALRTVIYRRLMLRVAERIAGQCKGAALVTGDSLGQVASQTLDNLTVVGAAANLLLLRPLVASDKREIIAEAERLGTYPISIQPDQDCCQLFMPRQPATHAHLEDVLAAESGLEIERLVEEACSGAEVVLFRWPPP